VNRPFDDQHQARVRLEAEAVPGLIQLSRTGIVKWTGSDVFDLGNTAGRIDTEKDGRQEIGQSVTSECP
jgi:hypothetical protein